MAEGHEQWDNNEGNNWQVWLGQALATSAGHPDRPQHLRNSTDAAVSVTPAARTGAGMHGQ
jgi:hypothetical protein